MKKIVSLIMVLSIALILGACGQTENKSSSEEEGQEPTVLKLGTLMTNTSPEGEAHQYFADLVEEKSNGQLKVEVYPSEQLGAADTQITNVNMGTQDMLAISSTFFKDYDQRLELSTSPFLFEDYNQFQNFFTGDIGKEINQNLIDGGIRNLNTERSFVRGPYRVLLSTKPVKSLEDVKGLKLRVFDSPIYTGGWSHLGANPTVIAWTETYLALNQGMADAVTAPISQVKSMNFAEVAPYMTIIDEYPQDVITVINEETFQSLSEEHQQILIDSANESGIKAEELVMEAAEKDIEIMKEENDLQVFEIDNETWTEAMSSYYDKLVEEGKYEESLINSIRSAK
ncbi:TRAP transporter substrate-binding protein [Gracilibacillus xinjiangensis]|uniref:TRAP transporter substrate-binding protein n=1 Tax=Gracilibacillus xinjiangensis TaxID=1193282 RepID=A0ABV8WX96_9BACI